MRWAHTSTASWLTPVLQATRRRKAFAPDDDRAGAVADALPQESIVAALATCLLDDPEPSGYSWPPSSIGELLALQGSPHGDRLDLRQSELVILLESGLVALNAAARRETGQPFARVDRNRQLRAIFRFESEGTPTGQRTAAAFIETFLALTVNAYLGAARRGPAP